MGSDSWVQQPSEAVQRTNALNSKKEYMRPSTRKKGETAEDGLEEITTMGQPKKIRGTSSSIKISSPARTLKN